VTRIALYSHDALGLGHVRRSLALASAFRALRPRPDLLVLSSVPEAALLPRPRGCDVLTLPGLLGRGQERYAARDLLGVPPPEVRMLRSVALRAALTAFAPDLLVVDRHPRGAHAELESTLGALPSTTRVVLGMRDVLDEPAAAAGEWAAHGCSEALDAWYDAVWVYGDRLLHDPTELVRIPHRLRDDVVFTGYLAPRAPVHLRRPAPTNRELGPRPVLGLVGGGADGAATAHAFVAAARLHGRPGVLVLGPQMPAEERAALRHAASGVPALVVHDFVPDTAPLLDRAAAVVAMGGSGTTCEVLASGLPALVVPRTRPRREQLLRTSLLARRRLVDLLHPDDLRPEAVAAWVGEVTGDRGHPPPSGVDLGGLVRVRDLAAAVLQDRRPVHVAV
jgi:predicted glycosyltransferase